MPRRSPNAPIRVGSLLARSLGAAVAVQVFGVGVAVQFLRLFLRVVIGVVIGLVFGPGEPLGLLLRLALGLFLQPKLLRPRLGALLLALLLAGVAFAADRLQISLEVVGAVVVVDLLTRLGVLDAAGGDRGLTSCDG